MPTMPAVLVPLKPSLMAASVMRENESGPPTTHRSHRRSYARVRGATIRCAARTVNPSSPHPSVNPSAETQLERSAGEVFGVDAVDEVAELVEDRLLGRFLVEH